MKKHLFFPAIAAMAISATMVSCSSDPEYDDTETINVADAQFQYDDTGVWRLNNQEGFLNIDDYEFSHYLDKTYGTVYGFTPSKVADTSKHSPLYEMPYASASGGGVAGAGSQYLVGYWTEDLEGPETTFSDRSCRIYAEDGDTFQPQSVMVCNTTYLMYAALDGTTFSAPFTAGDYVTLVANGVHLDGTTSTATYYLINIESSDVEKGILTDWAKFDLTDLGTCTGIYFTMDCSPNLKTGGSMSIPAYFCLDQLVVKD